MPWIQDLEVTYSEINITDLGNRFDIFDIVFNVIPVVLDLC